MTHQQLLLTAGQVLPGPPGAHIDHGAVLLEGDTIRAVGRRGDVEPLAGPHVAHHDYPDSTVLPGLINGHVHLSFDPGEDAADVVPAASEQALLQAMTDRAQQALQSGVTTMRDLGDRGGLALRLRDAIARGDVAGPRLLASGPPLTTPGGHCDFLGGAVSGADEMHAQARDRSERGADLVKIMVSGGFVTPHSSAWHLQYTTDELRAAVAEARRARRPVAAHAHNTDSIAAAVAAGVSTVEHCTWLRSQDRGLAEREDVAKQMATDHIAACPALPSQWPGFLDTLGQAGQRLLRDMQRLTELEVPFAFGTDAGVGGSPHDDASAALGLYAHLGWSHERVVAFATTDTAHALGLQHTTGQLAAGLSADLLVVNGDPLADLHTVQQPTLVVSRGRLVA